MIEKNCMRCENKIRFYRILDIPKFRPLFCPLCWKDFYSFRDNIQRTENPTFENAYDEDVWERKLHKIFIQPERSKREDLDCCKKLKKLEYLRQIIIDENIDCGEWHNDYADIVEIFNELIQESKMRCSEHCGNTVREAQ
jgi:hypothetical protein